VSGFGCRVDAFSGGEKLDIATGVAVGWRHEANTTVEVLRAVAAHRATTHVLEARKAGIREVWPILRRPKQSL